MNTSEARSVGIARPDLIDLALAIDMEVRRDQSPTVGINELATQIKIVKD